MTTDEMITSLDAAIASIKRLNELRRQDIREIKELRDLNAELLSELKLACSLLFSYVYLTEAEGKQIRELIAKAEKLK